MELNRPDMHSLGAAKTTEGGVAKGVSTSHLAHIDALSHDGRGVARPGGRTVFVDGALPGEQVGFRYVRRRGRFDEAVVTEVHHPSPHRVAACCPHYGVCGGCSLQHLSHAAQVVAKQSILLDHLAGTGRVAPAEVFPPVTGPIWGYRRRARLGVRFVAKKGGVLVGFREKASSFIADLTRCDVIHPSVGLLLPALRHLIQGLDARRRIPQVEVAVAEGCTALVFRHLDRLCDEDLDRLRLFAAEHKLWVYAQPGGPDSVHLVWPTQGRLTYDLPDFGIEIEFHPTQFVQVNAEINKAMVSRAAELLRLRPDDRVLDLFCGIGNFTLPLATRAQSVLGIEGDAGLVAQAQRNAERNGIRNVRYRVVDLNDPEQAETWCRPGYNKLLLDPPRNGAVEVVRRVSALGAERVVYISCDPATLARDAGELVRGQGFQLEGAGLIDMFPHTAHLEAIAVFARKGP